MHRDLYLEIADMLDYPPVDFRQRLETLLTELQHRFPAGAATLHDFRTFVHETAPESLQEYYTRTFDINPVTSLDVSHHIFGDTYKRGQFLAQLREELEKLGVGDRPELPDFLPLVLYYLAKSTDEEARRELVELIFLPALSQMERALSEGMNAYAAPVRLLKQVLMHDFRIAEPPPTPTSSEKLLTLTGE